MHERTASQDSDPGHDVHCYIRSYPRHYRCQPGLHAIQGGLHASVTVLQWVLDVYNLVYAGFILTGGVLGDIFGRRRIFVIGITLFTLGSLICALAPNASLLLCGRAVAGLGAALQLPGALSILTVTFRTASDRARAIAIWGGFNGLAMAVGPTTGGLLVDRFGWRSIFYLVVPFGVAALALTFVGVEESSSPEGRRIDLPGQMIKPGSIIRMRSDFATLPRRRTRPMAGRRRL